MGCVCLTVSFSKPINNNSINQIMIKSLLSLSLILLLSAAVLGQTRQITGKVTEKGGADVVPGASVTIKGASGGTQTDVNGNYKLNIPDKAGTVLIFRSIGFTTQE